MSFIPLRRRSGEIAAHAVVDDIDADLARVRWHLGASGYAVRSEWYGSAPRCRTVHLHREVLARMGHADAPEGDHKDRDKLNCRRSNLRPATRTVNNQNRVIANATGFRGVTALPSGRFRASLIIAGRRVHLGVFETALEAAAAITDHEKAAA